MTRYCSVCKARPIRIDDLDGKCPLCAMIQTEKINDQALVSTAVSNLHLKYKNAIDIEKAKTGQMTLSIRQLQEEIEKLIATIDEQQQRIVDANMKQLESDRTNAAAIEQLQSKLDESNDAADQLRQELEDKQTSINNYLQAADIINEAPVVVQRDDNLEQPNDSTSQIKKKGIAKPELSKYSVKSSTREDQSAPRQLQKPKFRS